jgi:bifunctional enzyme CysN/CysC
VAKFLAEGGTVALVALITPLRSHREAARAIAGDDFHEIYVSADLETCRARDPKGLYRLAADEKIGAFTGLASPYEPPLAPDLVLDTAAADAERSAAALVSYIRRMLGSAKAGEARSGPVLSLAAAAS